MRIIAGKHKNRVIPTSKKADYRPSTMKFKEALFSILTSGEFGEKQPLLGAKVLDLYSGTGALAFEALSRGAAKACLVDSEADYLKLAKQFAEKIGEGSNVDFLQMNALSLPKSSYQYNLIFLDPPYYKDLATKTIKCLIRNHWLENKAIIAVELAKTDYVKEFEELSLIRDKIYGNNKLLIFKYEQN
jgi:16S rRNA (guanine966-N2)-methyltransferase